MKNPQEFKKVISGRPETVRTQTLLFGKWILPVVENAQEEFLDDYFAIAVINQWKATTLKSGTIKILGIILRKYIKWQTGYTIKIKLGSYCQQSLKCWSKKQAERALRTAKILNKDFHDILLFGLHTGMRRGEIFGLKWKDWDMVKGKIKVSKSYEGPTKNGRARVISTSIPIALMLESRYIVGEEEENIWKKMDLNYFMKQVSNFGELPYISFHGCRHTFATLALERGISPKLISSILGHSNLSTTLNCYWASTVDTIEDLDFLPGDK